MWDAVIMISAVDGGLAEKWGCGAESGLTILE
jgi:hypothetical protein